MNWSVEIDPFWLKVTLNRVDRYLLQYRRGSIKFEFLNIGYPFSKYFTIRIQRSNIVGLLDTLMWPSKYVWSLPIFYRFFDFLLTDFSWFSRLNWENFWITVGDNSFIICENFSENSYHINHKIFKKFNILLPPYSLTIVKIFRKKSRSSL